MKLQASWASVAYDGTCFPNPFPKTPPHRRERLTHSIALRPGCERAGPFQQSPDFGKALSFMGCDVNHDVSRGIVWRVSDLALLVHVDGSRSLRNSFLVVKGSH